jgi:integrase/recombinase XerD
VLPRDLSTAVPAVAGWRNSGLPRGLDPEHVAALIDSCDVSRLVGRRDRAILMLLARLGLRACEVARLRLEHFDWHHGELIIQGKGRRDERLPLPSDVGEAVVAYLHADNNRAAVREVFVRVAAPVAPMTAHAIGDVVRRASERVGLRRVGPHRLRHSVATELLRAGTPLPEVGQVLRHRSAGTTAIYAKVDRIALRTLARPWPTVTA